MKIGGKEIASFSGATFDSRKVMPGMLFVALKGEHSDGHAYIPQAIERGAVAIIDGYGELDRVANEYRRSLKAKVVGITGSVGKTTTKEFVKTFLSTIGKVHATEGNFNNHIGLPITILNTPNDAEYLVLEMGTNHPGEIAHLCDVAEPDVGLVTNVGTAHLEFFKTKDGIAKEKGTLLARAREAAFATADNSRLDILKSLRGDLRVVRQDPPWLEAAMKDVLPGEHNVSNAAIAFAVAEYFGAAREDAVAALDGFELPGARWRKTKADGILFIDDSYNASPDSMIAALKAFAQISTKGRRIAILGDMLELGEESEKMHRMVLDFAKSLPLDAIFAVGEHSSRAVAGLSGSVETRSFGSVDELKPRLAELLREDDVVLLKASHGLALSRLVPNTVQAEK